MTPLSAVILAGGRSRRMGADKAFLDLGGQTLIERAVARLGRLSDDVIVVTNEPERFARLGARLVGDVLPGKGALGGVYSGLRAARHAAAVVVACDMPYLNAGLLRYMAGLLEGYDAVVPQGSTGRAGGERPDQAAVKAKEIDLHPLHAVYAATCLGAIEAAIARGDLRTMAFFDDVRVRIVGGDEIDRFDPQRLSIWNVNTPEEWQTARSLAGGT